MKLLILMISALLLFTRSCTDANSPQRTSTKQNIRKQKTNADDDVTIDTSDENIFLRIKAPMKNLSATSRDTIQFKCKISGWPDNIHYTWYKDNLFIDASFDPRVSIVTRPWGSRLRIKDIFTVDTGFYRCEGSNGYRRVHDVAHLEVKFERPPPLEKDETEILNIPAGKCEKYSGTICKDYFHGMNVFVDSYESQEDIEQRLQGALKQIAREPSLAVTCRNYILPALCYFMYKPCYISTHDNTPAGQRLCREDCGFLKTNVCSELFENRQENRDIEKLFQSANCSYLSSQKSSDCVKLNLTHSSLKEDDDKCYLNNGRSYRGRVSTVPSGKPCKPWPLHLSQKHPELLGGHNFCRNPEGVDTGPWCFVDLITSEKEKCLIQKCEPTSGLSVRQVVLIVCLSTGGFIILLAFTLLCCRPSRRGSNLPRKKSDYTRGASRTDVVLLPRQHLAPPLIDRSSILLLNEIGSGKYGKVFTGTIVNDSRFLEKQPYAFKIFNNCHVTDAHELFNREVNELSKLNHANLTNLQGVSLTADGTNISIFEFTNQPNLHEYLVRHHQKHDKSVDIPHRQDKISWDTLTKMSLQIASGMEYLASNNYIHRDLAARNVLICGNMDLKISCLGETKDSYLSCYYKSPAGTLMPIRWMAPESLQNWQFSDKSPVWSFGVLLWELFSYGSHPYCGYSNHEVLDMISRRQLLPCPDQCPAKIYSLMHECWTAQPMQRPHFKMIFNAIQTNLQTNADSPLQENSTHKEILPSQNPITFTNANWQNYLSHPEKESLLSENAIQCFPPK